MPYPANLIITNARVFTADVVRVKANGEWQDMAKVGRRPCENSEMERVS